MLNLFALSLRTAPALHLGVVLVSYVFRMIPSWLCWNRVFVQHNESHRERSCRRSPLNEEIKTHSEGEEWHFQLCCLTSSFGWNVMSSPFADIQGFHEGFSARAGATDPSGPAAPVIVVPPHNTSVVAGSSEATLECVASARYWTNCSKELIWVHCPSLRRT